MKRSSLPKTNSSQSNFNYVSRTTPGGGKVSGARIQKDAMAFTEFIEQQKKKAAEAKKAP